MMPAPNRATRSSLQAEWMIESPMMRMGPRGGCTCDVGSIIVPHRGLEEVYEVRWLDISECPVYGLPGGVVVLRVGVGDVNVGDFLPRVPVFVFPGESSVGDYI